MGAEPLTWGPVLRFARFRTPGEDTTMRKTILGAIAAIGVVAVACAPASSSSSTSAGGSASPATAAECAQQHAGDLLTPDTLTIGTGNPAYPPWWEGGTTKTHSDWEFNDPYLGQGFEGAVAFAVADKLGFSKDQVAFVPVKFNQSFAPGDKPFDFVLQQISYSADRDQTVDFSDSYYDVNQAVVSVQGSSIENATSLADLKDATIGAPSGTTSYDYIVNEIQPTQDPKVYDDLNGAANALKNGQIDGLVVDLPTAFFMTAVQIPKGIIVGQFPSTGQQEYFGMVFQEGNTLRDCVNQALAELKTDGTLQQIQQEWLSDKASAPVLSAG
jgi:polar amino acid transport system substrate-binding protein